MANLLGQNIGTNYKGILNLDTINTPLDATLRAVTDGEGNASPLQLSTDEVSLGGATGANWDNTNKRLGIGTNTPTASIEATTFKSSSINDNGTVLQFLPSYNMYTLSSFSIGAGDMTARLGVKGYGSTASTNAFLVQNSAGTALLTIRDDGVATFGSALFANNFTGNLRTDFINTSNNAYTVLQTNPANGNGKFYESVSIGTSSDPVASAKLELVSTTKGFLPPRMTTTQKNAIASPAAGLVVYDTDTNKLCCYDGSTWNDLF